MALGHKPGQRWRGLGLPKRRSTVHRCRRRTGRRSAAFPCAPGQRILPGRLRHAQLPGGVGAGALRAASSARTRSSKSAGGGIGTSLVRITEEPSALYWYLAA